MLTATDLAGRLDGHDTHYFKTLPDHADAKAAGLVIVYRTDDSHVCLAGALAHPEVDGFDTFRLSRDGVAPNAASIARDRLVLATDATLDEELREILSERARATKITPIDCGPTPGDGLFWKFETELPRATFMITENGHAWCEGFVFALSDLAAAEQADQPQLELDDLGSLIAEANAKCLPNATLRVSMRVGGIELAAEVDRRIVIGGYSDVLTMRETDDG